MTTPFRTATEESIRVEPRDDLIEHEFWHWCHYCDGTGRATPTSNADCGRCEGQGAYPDGQGAYE